MQEYLELHREELQDFWERFWRQLERETGMHVVFESHCSKCGKEQDKEDK